MHLWEKLNLHFGYVLLTLGLLTLDLAQVTPFWACCFFLTLIRTTYRA